MEADRVAVQCPYQGGPDVYRARFFMSLFNDSIEYDDASVCLQQGISRQFSPNQKTNLPILLLRPNPASNEVEVKISGIEEGQYSMVITDIQGRELTVKNNLFGDEVVKVQTNEFVPGVYYVIARKNKSQICREKLILIR